MLDCFSIAFVQTPPVILGRRLLPFSLGHAFLLDAAGNGFALSGEGGDIGQLAVAVEVCTRSFRDAAAFLRGECGAAEGWAERCADIDIAKDAAAFVAYTSAAITNPPRWKGKESAGVKCPWQLALFAAMLGDGSATPDTVNAIMDTPLSEVFAINAARQAWAGDDSLFTEEDAKAVETLKAMGAENGAS